MNGYFTTLAYRQAFAGLALLASSITAKHAYADLPAALQGVTFDQRLNAQVPVDLVFTNERGQPVRLGQFFGKKPVILVLAYYQCPRLCNLVLNGLVQGMLEMNFDAGKDFNVVTVSFDPREDWHLAAAKKDSYLTRYGRPGAADGWHFLTGEPAAINQLTDSVGFRYRFDEAHNQYIHAAGIMILTPQGKVSRYLYDVNFPGRDLRLALVEASHNRIGSPVDQVLLYCFHYDALLGKYSPSIMNLVRFAGVLTMVSIGGFILFLRKSGSRTRSAETQYALQPPRDEDTHARNDFAPLHP